ncbi:MAG: FAD-dependent oxidoreductase, partial [Desulfobacterales bacterium]|nr:FAD-dependent oxidoreductase [Desulfobacterales bacterium]
AGLDRPVQIGKIQRFLVEHAWERTFNVFEKKPLDKGKVAVVGAGPAGLSCAAELAREGFAVTVFEALPEPGGVLRYGVPAFRLDKSFLERELEEIRALGVEFKCNARIEGDKSAENLLDQGFGAVFLAPGAWGAARLQADRETLDGLYSSVEFLRAMRDGGVGELEKSVKGKTAAVIGGGSVAMDCATSAVRLGARDVYLLYRRSWSQMPAEKEERLNSLDEGVQYLLLTQPTGYRKDDSGRVSGVTLVHTRLGAPDASGRRRPEEIPGSEWVLDVDVVIEAIGNKADEEAVKCWPNVAVDEKKLIKVEADVGQTSVKGVFAGGDIVRGPDLVVTAVQDGKNAARAIGKYLSE